MKMLQESRLFKILYHLLSNGKATASELAEMFEVSIRTIYRDIDALSSAGIPVYSNNGRKGGIQLLDGFVLSKSTLSKQEQEEILFGLQSLAAAQYPNTNEILTKLGALFQSNAHNWIEIDFSRWGSATQREKDLFALIKTGILEKRIVGFDYFSSAGVKSNRTIEPVKLIYKDKAWYLYGYCLDKLDWRLFRVSRIKNAVLTDKHFSRTLEEISEIWAKPESYGPLIELILHFKPQVAYRLYDILDEDVINKDGEIFKVNVILPEDEWLYEFLMSFGENVTVIKPGRVKKELLARYERAIQAISINKF